MDFRFRILDGDVPYSGRELRGGWVEEQTGLGGDAAAVFFGPCDVATEDLVDLDDRRAGAVIVAARMAHVIIEHPGLGLESAVLLQRLLVCILCEVLVARGIKVRRDGDDIYRGGEKVTVSIAAPSPVSALIHLGINVDPAGAPVPATGLAAMGLDEREVATDLANRYASEIAAITYATGKVREVK